MTKYVFDELNNNHKEDNYDNANIPESYRLNKYKFIRL